MSDELNNHYGSDPGSDPSPQTDTDPIDEITPLDDSYYSDGSVKLTEAEIAQIWRRIDGGLSHQKRVFWPVYKAVIDLWDGKHWKKDRNIDEWDGSMVINVVPNIIKSMVESVAYSYPDFTIKPRNQEGEQLQTIIKNALDYWWEQSGVQAALKSAYQDCKLYGFGVVQNGWLFKTEKTELQNQRLEVLPDGVTADHAELAENMGLLPAGAAKDLVPADDLIEDRFQVQRINPMDFIAAPGSTSVVNEWAWCARLVRRPLADVQRDTQFRTKGKSTQKILVTKDLKGTTKLSEPYDSYESYLPDDILKMDEDRRPPDVRYVELIEYYERDRRLKVVLCREDRTRYLLAQKWTWKTNRYPFRTVHNTHTADQFYGKSSLEMRDMQVNINDSASKQMEHYQQFNRMYQVPENCLSDKAINGLQDGEPGTVIEYRQGIWGENPIQAVPHLQLQPEAYTSFDKAIKALELVTGLSQYQFHSAPSKRLTATEAQTISQANGILFMADAQQFTKLCKEEAMDLLALCEQFDAEIRNLPIFDDDQQVTEWRDFSGAEIRGNYMVDIWPESTQPPDAQADLQQNQQTLQILLQAAQIQQQMGGQMPRTLAIVFREGLRILNVRNIDRLMPLPPEQPPVQPQMPGQPQQQLPALPLPNVTMPPGPLQGPPQ